MNARIITANEAAKITARYAGTIAEAAKMLGCSVATVRRLAARLGARGLRSQAVAGCILIEAKPIDVVIRFGAVA